MVNNLFKGENSMHIFGDNNKCSGPKEKDNAPRFRTFKLNKILIVIFIIAIVAGAYFYADYRRTVSGAKLSPEELAQMAIDNTFSAESYRFQSKSTLFVEDEERIFSVFEGEKSKDKRHIEGNILGTPLNIFHIDGTTYQQDAASGLWYIVENNNLDTSSLLINELDPEKDFHFASLGEVLDLGREELDNINVRVIEFHPVLQNKWIEKYFTEITYTLKIIGSNQPYIVSSLISAVSKENESAKLVIENYFRDFNTEIEIEAPVV